MLLLYQGIPLLLLWFQGTAFFSFFARAFCIRLLNSIYGELGNFSFSCWFRLDFSLEVAIKTTRSKGMYKGNSRKDVCRLFGGQVHLLTAIEETQLPPSFKFTFTLPPKNEKPLTSKKLPPGGRIA